MKTLRNYIGGEWVAPSGEYLDLSNPATGEQLGRVPLSGGRDVDHAVAAAQAAFLKWREVPPVVRARYLFKLKSLMEEQFDDIATTVTRENGKTLDEARGSVRRGIENVEHACGIPTMMMGKTLEDVASGIDCEYVRQPLGVFAAITPFNFPAMVPCWFWPYAIATGNTFILKPSEQVPFAPTRIIELAHEAGIPPGVLNLVHGAKDVVNALLAHPGIAGISFVGSSPVAKYVYQEAAKFGKRVQALGGAKNHVIVMPDADMDRAVANISESLFGCAGQRCLAGSVVVAAGKAYEPFRDKLLSTAKDLRLGYGLEPGVNMGPVVSAKHKEKVLSYVEAGRKDGATLLLDGRATKVEKHPRGHFVGPTVFDGVHDDREGRDLRSRRVRHAREHARRGNRDGSSVRIRQRHLDLHAERQGGTRVSLSRRREHDRREHRRGGANGLLPVRGNERLVLRGPEGARAGRSGVLHG